MSTGRFLFTLMTRIRPGLFLLDLTGISSYYLLIIPTGLLLHSFFDQLAGLPPAMPLHRIVLWTILVSLGQALGLGGANISGLRFTVHVRTLLHKNMLRRILQMPGAQSLPDSPGATANIFRDDVEKILFWITWIQDEFGLLLTGAIAFTIMVQINRWVTLGTFVPLLLIIFIAGRLSRRLEDTYRASREATSQVTGAIGEIFHSVQAVKVANAEERMIDHFRRLNEKREETAIRSRLFTQLLDALSDNSVALGTGLILLLSARAMRSGSFTVGDFALFVAYLWPLAELLRSAGGLFAQYKQAGVAQQRLQALMQAAPPQRLLERGPVYLRRPPPPLTRPALAQLGPLQQLSVRGLTCWFGSGGIRQVDLEIKAGSLTVIAGRVGSGKTTLLRALLGLLPGQSGEIFWNGRLVDDPAHFLVPPRVAYTPQVPRLFSETVRHNIQQGWPADDSLLDQAIHQAVLEADLARLENGLETLVGPRGARLSGGQIQRVAAARMLLRRPALLVFDDLSSALDQETENVLWSRLWPDAAGAAAPTTFLVVSHRRPLLQRADQIILLQSGRVAGRGRLPGLLQESAEMRQLWSSGRGSDRE